ncbi:hypothetical protein BD779DRAFT_1469741 [Infundibulicybe gibba]|nr:hypothetical protein BD779DRAFT_1469741 [Infundibulicybe gibba]
MASRLPDGVYNTYRQYKHNCHLINRWVHQTVSRIRSAKPSPKPTKGRPNGINHLDNTSPRVSFREFIETTAAFYSSDVDAWKKNASHKKAIEVYMEAFQILKSAAANQHEHSGARVDSENNSSTSDAFSLTTAMHRVSLAFQDGTKYAQSPDSPSDKNDWIHDNPLINKPAGKSKGVRKPKTFPLEAYELVSDEDEHPSKPTTGSDALFALTCFLSDVSHLNTFCTSVWNSVEPQGKTSRITASFTTNHAVQIVRQLEYDLVQDFPEYKDLKKTYGILNVIPKTLDLPTSEALFSYQEQIMVHTFNSLSSYGEVLDVNSRPLMRDGFFGYFDPKQKRAEMTPAEKMREDQCLLFNYWPDLTIIHDRSLDPQGRFYGIMALVGIFEPLQWARVDPGLLPGPWLAASTGSGSECYARPVGKNVRGSGRISAGWVTYDTNKDMAQELVTQSRSQIHHWLACDAMWDLKIKAGWDKVSKQSTQKDSLWRMNPWLTANAMTDAYMQFFFLDLVVQSASGKNHLLLLDHLIDIFGQKVFTGAPPKTADKFLKNFDIMLGVRAEAEMWNMRADDYRTPKTPSDTSHDHPLSATVKLAESELGGQRGPLINLNLLKWPMLTGWIARCGLGPDDTILKKAGGVASRILGDKEVGFYVLSEDGSSSGCAGNANVNFGDGDRPLLRMGQQYDIIKPDGDGRG